MKCAEKVLVVAGLLGAAWGYRLPSHLEAESYTLDLELSPGAATFEGRAEIKLLLHVHASELIFHAKGITLLGAELLDDKGQRVELASAAPGPGETLVFKTDRTLDAGSYTLVLHYTGNITQDGAGLYNIPYTDHQGQAKWLIASQLRPTHGRRVVPCLDEPGQRAKIALTVRHPPGTSAVSSTPVVGSATRGNWSLTVFEETPHIPMFLLALMVSELHEIPGQGGFTGLALPGKESGMVYPVSMGPSLVANMERHLGLPFIHRKTHVAALPFLIPIAMENWGLFTFREENILYEEGDSPVTQKQRSARFLSHEISHSWMGNTVSLAWWDYLWLSEVFSMYYEYYIPNLTEPSWGILDQLVVDLHQLGLLEDSMPSEPLTTSVTTPAQIAAKFSGLTYSKGPALLRMVIHTVTEEKFLDGYRTFLVENAFGSVEPDVLWNAIERAAPKLPAPLSEIMDGWTSRSGYPLVSVDTSQPGHIMLTQKMFKLDKANIVDNRTWWIPLTFTTSEEGDFDDTKVQVWFPPESHLLVDIGYHPQWVIFNKQSAGFYRVNYNIENWKAIIEELQRDHARIATVNRANLIDDSMNLARGGDLSYKIALELVSYLSQEGEYVPWLAAAPSFRFLHINLAAKPSLQAKFKRYLSRLLENIFSVIGFSGEKGEAHGTTLLRELLVEWACLVGHPQCIAPAEHFVASLTKGIQPNKVDPEVEGPALCYGVEAGGEAEWQTILSLYNNGPENKKALFLSALACTCQKHLIQNFLVGSIGTLNEKDWGARFRAMSTLDNAQLLLNILIDNQKELQERFGVENFTKYFGELSDFLGTKEQDKQLEELEKSGVKGLSLIRKGIAGKMAWLKSNGPQLNAVLAH